MSSTSKRTRSKTSISKQIEDRETQQIQDMEVTSDTVMVSTGSTLLDLAISGSKKRGGGLPGGIMVIAYGPSSSGKSVLACEVAGNVQRAGGMVKYRDTEARLDQQFASLFGIDFKEVDLTHPNTVVDAFNSLHKWEVDTSVINGYVIDSLAALSTDIEMEKDEGDKMGMRRAKDFSEQLRKGARMITNNNILLFCTNQIRQNTEAMGMYARKDINPGGKAIEFYASVILRFSSFSKIRSSVRVAGKEVKRVTGIEGEIEVVKNSICKPYRTAPITIDFSYGIDDIRENLVFIKRYTGNSMYYVNDTKLSNGLEKAISVVENENLEDELKNQVIDLWEEIENKFYVERKDKKR